jgi:hypothetical protein
LPVPRAGSGTSWQDPSQRRGRTVARDGGTCYAGSELEVRLGGNHLVAIITGGDGTLVEVITKAEPEGTIDQLRPIADELVEGVETKLG